MNIKDVPTLCTLFVWMITLLLPCLVQSRGFPYDTFPEEAPVQDEEFITNTKRNDGLNLSLCPGGVNKLRCIHSYLTLYAQMQNGITDPVALRNIGKRNMPYQRKGEIVCPPHMNKIECYDYAMEYYLRVMKPMFS